MIGYRIISTGSCGNAVVINKEILIDVGVSYKKINAHTEQLQLVLLTHCHSDHFNKFTIHRLAKERPTLRWGCPTYLVGALMVCGVDKRNIDVMEWGRKYDYGTVKIIPLKLYHNVPNTGYKLHFRNGERMIFATDTGHLEGIVAKNYDLYMLEANYTAEQLKERIEEKVATGEYVYEHDAARNHLSKEQCDDFIMRNIGAKGQYVYLHQHRDKEAAT